MIEERIYPVAELPPLIECQVRDFVRIVWTGALVDDPSVPLGPPDRDPVHIVIVDGTMLISHVQMLTFTLEHTAQHYRVCGVSGVFTYPGFRGQGYGERIVTAGNKFIDGHGVDFGMLFTSPDLEKFYNRHGWIAIPKLTILEGDPADPKPSDEFTMLYPVTSHGQQAVQAFENSSLYIGPRGW
jgi:GNAT superfamily N-acetyltransferase